MSRSPAQTQSSPIEDFLVTVLRRNTPTLMSSIGCQSVTVPFSTGKKAPTTWTPSVQSKLWVCKLKQRTRMLLRKESSRDATLTKVMRFTREGWPMKKDSDGPAEQFRKSADSLSVWHGCLYYGARVVIPTTLCSQVLSVLQKRHFGSQRMKQLARTAVYWPSIDSEIVDLYQQCPIFAGHQSEPWKAAIPPACGYWRLYQISLHCATKSTIAARGVRAFRFTPYCCRGLRCHV